MSYGNPDRFEYIKQPHIVALIVVLVFVLGAGVYTATRRVRNIQRVANLETASACREFIKDETLCQFAAVSETTGSMSYTSVITTSSEADTSISTTKVENINRMQSVTLNKNLVEIEAFAIIDADSYIKDAVDNAWFHYEDPDYEPAATDDTMKVYDFSNDTSTDVIEFRDYYKSSGQEPCGDKTCYKYEITVPESTMITFIWFDTEDYLLRRYQSTEHGTTTNTQMDYTPVTITAPAPIKSVSAEEFDALLGE